MHAPKNRDRVCIFMTADFWKFLKSFGCFWKLLVFFEDFWMFFEDFWVFLKTFGCFWRLFSVFWRLLGVFVNFWVFLKTFGCFWRLLGVFEDFGMFLKTFGCFWRLLGVFCRNFGKCRSGLGFLVRAYFFYMKGTPFYHFFSLSRLQLRILDHAIASNHWVILHSHI